MMRFKIRTLLILITLVGLLAGYYVSVWSQVSAERRAFETLREHDADVQLATLRLFLHDDHVIADAERILKQSGFDPADFGAPVYEERYRLLTFSTSDADKADKK